MIVSILTQALLFYPFVLGVYLSFKLIKKPDLALDGSFVLGAGVTAKLLLLSFPVSFVLCASFLCSAMAGVLTSLIQYREKVSSIVAGVVVLFILQSLNLIIMGRPNLNIMNKPTLFTFSDYPLIALLGLCTMVAVGLALLLFSRLGLFLRSYGCNPMLFHHYGKSKERYRTFGFALSNGLVGLSGSLHAQYGGYADISMGLGLVIVGLISVLISQEIKIKGLKVPGFAKALITCLLSAALYFSVVYTLTAIGVPSLFLKLLLGICLAVILMYKMKTKSQTFNKGSFA